MAKKWRRVSTTLDDILDLVSCAEVMGFARSVFFSAMADITGKVSDEEIDRYAEALSNTEGYGEEDGDSARERLAEWRDQYCEIRVSATPSPNAPASQK